MRSRCSNIDAFSITVHRPPKTIGENRPLRSLSSSAPARFWLDAGPKFSFSNVVAVVTGAVDVVLVVPNTVRADLLAVSPLINPAGMTVLRCNCKDPHFSRKRRARNGDPDNANDLLCRFSG